MTRDKFQIFGDSLIGHQLSFDVASLKAPAALIDMANVIYKQGRESASLSYDDRFDLHCAVEVLRALAVIVGPTPMGDRHRRVADILSRMLQEQEGSQ